MAADPTRDIEALIAGGATFLPLDPPSRSAALLAHAAALRERSLLACCQQLASAVPDLCAEAGLDESMSRFMKLSPERKRQFLEYPPVLIWLQQIPETSVSRRSEFRDKLSDLGRLLSQFSDDVYAGSSRLIPGTSIQVVRYDVDPLIASHTPRMYDFPDAVAAAELEHDEVYGLDFFVDVATAALERIRDTWPAAYADLALFLRTIIHLPGAPFKSASTERYSGIVFATANDRSLLEVEESLIHECGHHVLYTVMGFDRLVFSTFGDAFRLPWSGLRRDLDGYFHAFYVYVYLASYFERVHGRSAAEQQRARAKLARILKGLVAARAELESLDRYTVAGRGLLDNLARQVNALARRHPELLDEAGEQREPACSRDETVRRLAAEIRQASGSERLPASSIGR
jgi:hypothetical protein